MRSTTAVTAQPPKRSAAVLVAVVRAYQRVLSPLTPGHCRYQPTCSSYMIEAINTHGAARGSWLGIRRLCRCHPWGGHGYDPVPEAHEHD